MSELIQVEKDGERIWVHPLTLQNHRQLGWKIVADAAAEKMDEQESPATSVERKPKKKSN